METCKLCFCGDTGILGPSPRNGPRNPMVHLALQTLVLTQCQIPAHPFTPPHGCHRRCPKLFSEPEERREPPYPPSRDGHIDHSRLQPPPPTPHPPPHIKEGSTSSHPPSHRPPPKSVHRQQCADASSPHSTCRRRTAILLPPCQR